MAPTGAAASNGASAALTASPTTCSTKNLARNRASSFAGCTFTSTASPGRSRKKRSDGRSPGAIVERYPSVAGQRKRDIGTRERDHRERFDRGARLRRGRTEEFPARRRVVEQATYGDRGAALAHRVFDRVQLRAGDAQPRGVFAFATGLELEARDRRDGGERLAAESERRHTDQVGRRADLARRVALQRELRVVAIHPRAVVAHANQRLAPVLQLDADRPGAGIEAVLDQLLDDGGRPLDDFAR